MNSTNSSLNSLNSQGKDTKINTTQATNLNEAVDFNTIETDTQINTNDFPVNSLPPIFKDVVIDLKESLNFPIDYTGAAILTAVATIIGTSAKIKVKDNWYEFASLYIGLIGDAGANKTHPVNPMFNPIRDIDYLALKKFSLLQAEYEDYLALPKKEQLMSAKVHKPTLKKSILTNFTPEVLNLRLNDNLRGCTIVSDELATFLDGMNNYSKGDQTSVYLSFWSNQPTTIDRIGNPIPLYIKQPYLSIIGGLQPRMLKQAFPVHKTNNGFLQRFLFAYPANTVKQAINDNHSNSDLLNIVIADEQTGNTNSKVYYWSDEAKAFFYTWQKQNCELVNSNQNNVKGEIISKFDNHFIRLALILQIMENYNTHEISLKAVQGASDLCKYFMNNAFKVLAKIQDLKSYVDTLPTNKKSFYNELPQTFTTDTAILLGANYGIKERTVKEFIKDNLLFEHLKHGNYKKIIKD
jgi:hypothetical protein